MSGWSGLLAAALLAGTGSDWRVRLVDVAEHAGLKQPSVYGGLDRKRFIIETNGAGVAWIDYDNDGWVDVFAVDGGSISSPAVASRSHHRLFRNLSLIHI